MQPINLSSPDPNAPKASTPAGNPAADATTGETSSQTSNSTTTTNDFYGTSIVPLTLEAQVLRNGLPLTRPTPHAVGAVAPVRSPGSAMVTPWIKLFPGAVNTGQDVSYIYTNQGSLDGWMYGTVQVFIDSMPLSPPVPVTVYADIDNRWPNPGWSSITHFPIVSDREHFAGVHTLMLRAYRTPAGA